MAKERSSTQPLKCDLLHHRAPADVTLGGIYMELLFFFKISAGVFALTYFYLDVSASESKEIKNKQLSSTNFVFFYV